MHWTYAETGGGDLAQGDILLPNERLRAALEQVHGWFVDPKYLGFLVLSQSCDLVRREGELCKTPYITIAAIRPLRQVLLQLLRQQCRCISDRYFLSSEKGKASEFLTRIINQNETALGLFYLHPEATVGIAEESVALLRVSIALRSREHYDTLLSARTGGLQAEFVNKLGWLCGNLFSRVGVTDWTENQDRLEQATKLVGEMLLDLNEQSPKFIDSKRFEKDYRAGKIVLKDATPEQVEAELAKLKGPTFKETALQAVERALVAQKIEGATIEKAKQNLANDAGFGNAVRPGSE